MEKIDGLDEQYRTFETRLVFIKNIFSNKFLQSEILANCIKHKLSRTTENFKQELELNSNILQNKNPIKVLKKEKSINGDY